MADKYVDSYASGAKTCYDIRCNACGTLVYLKELDCVSVICRFLYLSILSDSIVQGGMLETIVDVSILRGHLQKAGIFVPMSSSEMFKDTNAQKQPNATSII
jgi:hypothetical protein